MTYILGLVLLVLATTILHEAGHAIAMMRRDIGIQEVGLGFPLPGKFNKFKLTLRSKFLPFPITIYPLQLGAYVMMSDEGLKKYRSMGYKDKASCCVAGTIMNLAFAAVLFIAAMLAINPFGHRPQMITLIVSIAALVATLLLRRVLSWIMPVLGIATLGVIAYLLVPSDNSTITLSFGLDSWSQVLLLGGVLSLVIGLSQIMPLMPLDGGKLMSAFLQSRRLHRFDKIYSDVTFVIFVLSVVLSCVFMIVEAMIIL